MSTAAEDREVRDRVTAALKTLGDTPSCYFTAGEVIEVGEVMRRREIGSDQDFTADRLEEIVAASEQRRVQMGMVLWRT